MIASPSSTTRRRIRLARGALLVAAVCFIAVPVVAAGPNQGVARADTAADLKPVTADGTGPFSGLKVTVAQTANLVNQSVEVTWSGAAPTLTTANGNALGNYLQLMQCWAEPGKVPTREQCQYGGYVDVPDGAANIASRQMTGRVVDPLETTYVNAPGDLNIRYVDFKAVDGTKESDRRSQFFDGATTNEVPIGRTSGDGTGQLFFEMQTGLEAPGLGCGQVIDGRAPDCFLVVVPRNLTEVTGDPVGARNDDALQTTPLSQSNWNNHIAIPLQFQSIGQSCVFGRAETPTYGSDFITEAITSWQPKLCGLGPRNYGFTSLSDDTTRGSLVGDDPGMAFVNRSIKDATGVVYAPVSVSALALVANIDQTMPNFDPNGRPIGPEKVPADIKAKVGKRFEDVKLNPRLLAKLLTQSYLFDLANGTANVSKNPFDISKDKEFLALNPDFKPQGYTMSLGSGLGRVLVNAGLSDSADLVWRYVLSDQDAVDFLNGKPDPYGTTLNEYYKGLTLPTNTFPRADLGCRLPFTAPEGFVLENCTLDIYPYGGGFSSTARQVARGDTGRRSVPRLNEIQTYGLEAPQVRGKRAMLGLTDTASASRYRQVTVKLRNAAGNYVAPDASGMSAALSVMPPDTQGVVINNLTSSNPDAYPLTVVTYAAAIPGKLSADQRSDYAKLLDYAAADGQVVGSSAGQLPEGYLPLTADLRQKTLAAATALRTYMPPAPSPTPTVSPTVTETPTEPATTEPVVTDPVVPSVDSGMQSPVTGPSASPSPLPSSSPITTPVSASGSTPADPAAASRTAVLVALVLGGAALLARAVLPWVARR